MLQIPTPPPGRQRDLPHSEPESHLRPEAAVWKYKNGKVLRVNTGTGIIVTSNR
jgi:hypothetical protein